MRLFRGLSAHSSSSSSSSSSRVLPLPLPLVRIPHAAAAAAEAQGHFKSRVVLDVVVPQRFAIVQRAPCVNESLFKQRDSLFHLDDRFHGVDGVRSLDVQSDRLLLRQPHKYLHHGASIVKAQGLRSP